MENYSKTSSTLKNIDDNNRPTDTHPGESLGDVLKHDWEQTKADLPGLEGEDTGQTIKDTIKGEVHDHDHDGHIHQ